MMLFSELREGVARLPRWAKQTMMMALDTITVLLAVWAAFALRTGTWLPQPLAEHAWLLPSLAAITVGLVSYFGLYKAVVRHMGPQSIISVLKTVSLSTLIFLGIVATLRLPDFPRTIFGIYWLVATLSLGGSRFLIWASFQALLRRHQNAKPVAIYGAGAGGAQLASSLANGQEYQPVFFIDDSRAKQGTLVAGLPVYSREQLPEMVDEHEVRHVLLAMPRLSRGGRRAIIDALEPLSLHIMTMPTLADLLDERARLDEVREVEIEDLLGRDSVDPEPSLLDHCLRDKIVMVTGAGGTIGAELCRQIIKRHPKQLIMVERAEFGLYSIDKELRRTATHERHEAPALVPVLADVTSGERMTRLLEAYQVDTLYHAAAYKHVPLVEDNMIEGIRNNVFGTLQTAQAAVETGVDHFVLISTDKAVRPSNVMGASKRLSELLLQGIAKERPGKTTFSIVRFGNVLGSSGSVVPLFREQIRQGGPVTVTHPEVTRYFMTIPEAASLVIQAGAMARGGDIFVLDMGEPVRIVDLARKMIHLSGLEETNNRNPEGDIRIDFIGLRPGEKLHEELLLGNEVTGTDHPMILRAEEQPADWPEIKRVLRNLELACNQFQSQHARTLLLEAVVSDDAGSMPLVEGESRALRSEALPEKVTPLR